MDTVNIERKTQNPYCVADANTTKNKQPYPPFLLVRTWSFGKFNLTDLSTDGVRYGENTTATENTKEQDANKSKTTQPYLW
jgi:hypothetical protein